MMISTIFSTGAAPALAGKGGDHDPVGLTVLAIDLVKGRRDVLEPGVALLIQALVVDPILTVVASTVMVTADGYEELTQPLTALKTVS